jgi:hypothetical protein
MNKCFKLMIFGYSTSCLILIFWYYLLVFVIQTFLFMIVWLIVLNKACYRSQKCYFLGLTMATYARFIAGFMGNSLHVFRRNIALALSLNQFWSISLHITLRYAWLINNLGFICINNIFLMGFNPRVLILNWNLF